MVNNFQTHSFAILFLFGAQYKRPFLMLVRYVALLRNSVFPCWECFLVELLGLIINTPQSYNTNSQKECDKIKKIQ